VAEIKEKILNYSKTDEDCRKYGFQFPSRIPTYHVNPLTGDYAFKNDKLHLRFVKICDLEEFTVSRQAKLLHRAMKELLNDMLMFRRYGAGKTKGYVYSHSTVALGIIDPVLLGLALEYKNEAFVSDNICNKIPSLSIKTGAFKTFRRDIFFKEEGE